MTIQEALKMVQELAGEGVTVSVDAQAFSYANGRTEIECSGYVAGGIGGLPLHTAGYQSFEPMISEVAAKLEKPNPVAQDAPVVEL